MSSTSNKSMWPWGDKTQSFLESRITSVSVTLILAAIAYSGRVNVTIAIILLILAFLTGSFGIFRSGLKGYHRIIWCLVFGIGLTVILWWIQPNAPQPKQSTGAESVVQQPKHPTDDKPKLPIATAELEQNLREQIQFLQRSSAYFDQGMESEAKRIASALHILFVSTKGNPSLLEQLRIREELAYPDTAFKEGEHNIMPYAGLAGTRIEGSPTGPSAKWIPNYLLAPDWPVVQHLPFKKWWSMIVINDKKGVKFTRESLLLAVSEQDGGIEVASNFDPAYVALARRNAMDWQLNGKPIPGVELASIRQIAWETLEALRKRYPQFFLE